MISKETMRVALTAAKIHLRNRESAASSLDFKLRFRTETSLTAKSAGAKTAALNDLPELRSRLEEAQRLAQEVRDAISELQATDVGAEIWKELEST